MKQNELRGVNLEVTVKLLFCYQKIVFSNHHFL